MGDNKGTRYGADNVKNMHIFSDEEDQNSKESFSSKLSNKIDAANSIRVQSVEFAKNHTPSKCIERSKKDLEKSKEKVYGFFNEVDSKMDKIKKFHNSAHNLSRKDNIVSNGKGDAIKNIIAIALYTGAVFLWIFGHWFISVIIFVATTIIYFLLSYNFN